MYLNDDELFVETFSRFPAFVTGDLSLSNCHQLPDISEQLSLYQIKMYIDTVISGLSAVSICSSYWVTHLVNGTQFVNATLAFVLPPVAVISDVARIYVPE